MYDPPYESPLEDSFAWNLAKYLRRDTQLEKQVEISTICGVFRLDFVATSDTGERIAFECDGAEFHEVRRDEWRDAMILGSGSIDSIIRLRGSDLTYHMEDVMLLLARWYPLLFSDRSEVTLNRLASDRARRHEHEGETLAMLTYWSESLDRNNPLHLFMLRRNRCVPRGRREYWQSLFAFAKSRGGGRLDGLVTDWDACGSGAVLIA